MNRGKPLQRKTELKRTPFQPSRKPLPKTATRKVAGTGPKARAKRMEDYATQRRIAFDRAGGRCEACGKWLAVNAFQTHHRVERSLGGSNAAWNLLVCCPPLTGCLVHPHKIHGDLSFPSHEYGYLVPSRHPAPWRVPVRLFDGRRVLFTPEGTYEEVQAA